MSTEWGYYCLDCDSSSECVVKYDYKEILTGFLMVTRFMKNNKVIEDIQVTIEYQGGVAYFLTCFLEEHFSHNIVLQNEYGERLNNEHGKKTN